MFQKCPVCNGEGKVESKINDLMLDVCGVCCGKKIISKLNGLPPGVLVKARSKQQYYRILNSDNFEGEWSFSDCTIEPISRSDAVFFSNDYSDDIEEPTPACTHEWVFGEKYIYCDNCSELASF